ncbi:hypothetical protein IEQ34_012049 [Dendrobium chrysotoxum]|uniref:Uncharacterized protein n=1 Tax=Dendrobium chrysotoxum TaxID=161865 RepID=A0AAV7GT30_DENCH|nr:hypothetical protein IEQ34_012049 [Dendrobium chrysotoxum]
MRVAHIRVAYVAARKLAAVKAWQKSKTLRRSNAKQEITQCEFPTSGRHGLAKYQYCEGT